MGLAKNVFQMSFSTIFGVQGGPSIDNKMLTTACSKTDLLYMKIETTSNENSEEEFGFDGFVILKLFTLNVFDKMIHLTGFHLARGWLLLGLTMRMMMS